MTTFRESRLWQATLAERRDDRHSEERARLRGALILLAEGADQLAVEIKRDLPDFTRHDRAHYDELWHLADLIAGNEVQLLPSESFVLGAAFLLHDLGLGLAAYPEGPDSLRRGPQWSDAVALAYHAAYGRSATEAEFRNPEVRVAEAAMQSILLGRHARRAEKLTSITWPAPHGEPLFLIEDRDVRQAFGQVIGRVAHSHWWEPARLPTEFTGQLGAPAWLPPEWIVRPLLLACLLRTADAAHLDASRAPAIMYGARQRDQRSRDHWRFQSRMLRPTVDGGRLSFTSSSAFPIEEATAWWLGFDLIGNCHRELQAVDAVLADAKQPRLEARSVAGAEDPVRLAALVETKDWLPVDASLRVSDVAGLVNEFGGKALYGRDKTVALRELIQNSSDAIRARRALEKRSEQWGSVVVRLVQGDDNLISLEVEDNGIGMSPRVMTSALVDFGQSFWRTPEVANELPGLAGSSFRPVGCYGIGFNAVFMLGSQVSVISRRADAARQDTYVLEFPDGLAARPIPRKAIEAEQLQDGGTLVRVILDQSLYGENGLLHASSRIGLKELCGYIAPTSSVTVEVEENAHRTVAVTANDWKTLDSASLLERIADPRWELRSRSKQAADAPRLLPVVEPNGEMVGRCAIGTELHDDDAGVVTVGGFRAMGLKQLAGVLLGRSERAARDLATPLVSGETLARWASQQAGGFTRESLTARECHAVSWATILCGGDPGELPICTSADGSLTYRAFIEWARLRDQVLVVGENILSQDLPAGVRLELAANTVASPIGLPLFLQGSRPLIWPLAEGASDDERSAVHPIHRALAEAWGSSANVGRTSGRRTSKARVTTKQDGQPVASTRYQLYLRREIDFDVSALGDTDAAVSQVPVQILLVEDDPVTASLRAELFAAHGCNVTVAHTSDEAIAYLNSEESLDLIVTDIKLAAAANDRSGMDLAQLVKDIRPDTPVAAYSGYFTAEDLAPDAYASFDRVDFKGALRAADLDRWALGLISLARSRARAGA